MSEVVYEMRACTPSPLAQNIFLHVQHIGRWNYGDDYLIDRSGLHSFLLQYIYAGQGFIHYRGKEYALKEGDVFLIDCMDVQKYGTLPYEHLEVGWTHFDGPGAKQFVTAIHERHGPVFHVPRSFMRVQERLLEWMRRGEPDLEAKASLAIMQMLTELFVSGYSTPMNAEPTSDYGELMKPALSYIRQHYAEQITVEALARRVNMSKSHFSRAFRRCMSCSPIEFVIRERINASKSLLIGKQAYSIEQVAREVGFESVSHFIVMFKKHEQLTPLQYRKLWSSFR